MIKLSVEKKKVTLLFVFVFANGDPRMASSSRVPIVCQNRGVGNFHWGGGEGKQLRVACASVFGLGDQFCCWGGICSIRLRVAGERELLTEWRSLCVLHLLRFWYASDISNERGRKRIKKKRKKKPKLCSHDSDNSS